VGSSDSSPSAGRFTRWAIGLVLPLVLSAAAMPWILEKVRANRGAFPASASEPIHRPELPSSSEIEAATKSVNAAAKMEAQGMAGSTIYAPRGGKVAADGKRIAPFYGFGLSIESAPNGAIVHVAGRDVGETPILASVECDLGQELEVVVEKPGYRSARRAVPCRENVLVEVSFKLRR
jgi:hypothetical protein